MLLLVSSRGNFLPKILIIIAYLFMFVDLTYCFYNHLFPVLLSEISQLWSEDANLTFFIHYHSATHDSVCEAISDFSYEDTLIKDLECYDGWTDVGLFVYYDEELTLEECEECRPPDIDEENVVAYYFEVRMVVDLRATCCIIFSLVNTKLIFSDLFSFFKNLCVASV